MVEVKSMESRCNILRRSRCQVEVWPLTLFLGCTRCVQTLNTNVALLAACSSYKKMCTTNSCWVSPRRRGTYDKHAGYRNHKHGLWKARGRKRFAGNIWMLSSWESGENDTDTTKGDDTSASIHGITYKHEHRISWQ